MTKRVGLYVSKTQNGEVYGLNKKIQYVIPENKFFSVPGMQFWSFSDTAAVSRLNINHKPTC